MDSFLATGVGRKKRRPLSDETTRSYRRDYAVIEEFIPDIQLRQVRTKDINRIFEMLIELDGDDICSQSAYNNVKNLLSGAFKIATGKGLVEVNPVRDAFSIEGKSADTHAYTLEEARDIMNAADDHTLQAAFMVEMFTGLRRKKYRDCVGKTMSEFFDFLLHPAHAPPWFRTRSCATRVPTMVQTQIDLKHITPDFVRAELEFRRNKQSAIFAWCSTILVAITSGVIVVQIRQPPLELSDTQKELLSWAIIVLAAHSVSWLGHNAHLEQRAALLFETQVAETIWGTKKRSVGYRSALIMLGVGAIVAIWLPPNPAETTKIIVAWSVAVSATLLSGWAAYSQFERLKEKNKGQRHP